MPFTMAVFEVDDYAKWKAEFDAEDGVNLRNRGQMKSYHLFQVEGNPNKLAMLSEWDDLDTAREFIQSEEFQKVHEQSGAFGEPVVYFVEEIEKRSV